MSIKEKAKNLHELILNGQMLDAFEKYYDEDVVMQENNHEPRKGKTYNRAHEEKFLGSIEEFYGAKVHSVAVDEQDGKVAAEWTLDLKFQGAPRMQMNQVSVQTWKDGKVVHEKFYYNEN